MDPNLTYKLSLIFGLKLPIAIVGISFSIFNAIILLKIKQKSRNDIFIIFHSIFYTMISLYGFVYSTLVMGVNFEMSTGACATNYFIYHSLLSFIVFSLCIMSIDRVLAIKNIMTYNMRNIKKITVILLVAIIISCIVNVPLSLCNGPIPAKDDNMTICSSARKSVYHCDKIVKVKHILDFLLPTVITIVCYAIIFRAGNLSISNRITQYGELCSYEDSSRDSYSGEMVSVECTRIQNKITHLVKEEKKLLYLCISHASSFPLCYLPFTVYVLIMHNDGTLDNHICHVLTCMTEIYITTMSILYTVTHKVLRDKLRKFLHINKI